MGRGGVVTDADFRRLLEFRDTLRRFLHWSEAQARAVGLTAPQHQLLLAIRGHGSPPSIREVADHLMLRHHSAVELVDRVVALGLIERRPDPIDHRVVRVELTAAGLDKIESLAATHLEELSRLRTIRIALGRPPWV
jgi:DNA-binding MarR family transcriptional regulator